LPVVTVDLGGPKEIVDGTCGVRVRQEASAVAQALARYLDHPEARAGVASQAKLRARALCDEVDRVAELREAWHALSREARA
jgi:glycosyltransferase involved in cell wall biosynthesis